MKILVTGAAGDIGRVLREGLHGRHELVRLVDRVPMAAARPGEEVIEADLGNPEAAARATAGMDAVVHLAARAGEADWPVILRDNIALTISVVEAAHRAGARRLVFASSNHAIGFHPRSRRLDPACEVRPDTRYGVSKAFGEDLGRLYADKHGLAVTCLRIGSFQERPRDRRQLSTWLSHGDMVRLVETALAVPPPAFEILWGVSRNTRSWWDNSRAIALGYEPQDDAEAWANELLAADPPEPGAAMAWSLQGGTYCEKDLDGPPPSAVS